MLFWRLYKIISQQNFALTATVFIVVCAEFRAALSVLDSIYDIPCQYSPVWFPGNRRDDGDVMTWKSLPHYWPLLKETYWPLVGPHTKGQHCGALTFPLALVWISCRTNSQSSCRWFETPWCVCNVTVIGASCFCCSSYQSKDLPFPTPETATPSTPPLKYAMNNKRRGKAVIISNTEFDKKTGKGPRKESHNDAAYLYNIFKCRGFEIELCRDLKVAKMNEMFEKCKYFPRKYVFTMHFFP